MLNTVITDMRIPFRRSVMIPVKSAIAAIPAAMVLTVFYLLIFTVAATIVAMLGVSPPTPNRTI